MRHRIFRVLADRLIEAAMAASHTHASTTDPQAKLYKKGKGKKAKLCFMGHAAWARGAG
jgi:hypothetical protein